MSLSPTQNPTGKWQYSREFTYTVQPVSQSNTNWNHKKINKTFKITRTKIPSTHLWVLKLNFSTNNEFLTKENENSILICQAHPYYKYDTILLTRRYQYFVSTVSCLLIMAYDSYIKKPHLSSKLAPRWNRCPVILSSLSDYKALCLLGLARPQIRTCQTGSTRHDFAGGDWTNQQLIQIQHCSLPCTAHVCYQDLKFVYSELNTSAYYTSPCCIFKYQLDQIKIRHFLALYVDKK